MAFVPPPNNAGVAPPPFPQNPPTLGDVTNTKEYSERLSLSKRLQTPGATATDDEIGAAERYHHDIVMTNTVMGPAPPQWLVQLMGAGQPIWLGNLIGNIAQMQADMQAGFANINQMQANMQAGIANMQARQANARITKFNETEMNRTGAAIVDYQARQKEVPGDGTALANALLLHGMGPLAILQVVPAVGTAIGATINPNGLTHLGILQLIQFYNENFGILPGELIGARIQRVSTWLTKDV